MAAATASLPVSLAAGFFKNRDEDSVHAVQFSDVHIHQQSAPLSSSVLAGSILRATPGQGIRIDRGDGTSLQGQAHSSSTVSTVNGQKDGGLDCVLLWDQPSQTYILHRLASTIRLSHVAPSMVTPERQQASNSTAPKASTPIPATLKRKAPASDISPSPRPPPKTARTAPYDSGITSAATSPMLVQHSAIGSTATASRAATLGLGITAPAPAARSTQGRKGLLPVSASALIGKFGNDVANGSDSAADDDEDDDIDFEDFGGASLSLGEPLDAISLTPVPTPNPSAYSSAQLGTAPQKASSLSMSLNNHVVTSDSDSDSDDGDLDAFANDLEDVIADKAATPLLGAKYIPARGSSSMAPQSGHQTYPSTSTLQPGVSSPVMQSRASLGSKRIPMSGSSSLRKSRDSDIASSSESDSD